MTTMRFGGDWLQRRVGRVGHRLSIGIATVMPKLYDDGDRLQGRRGARLGDSAP